MSRIVIGIIYALVMIAVIVTIDLALLRDQPLLRLLVNALIAAAFAAFYVLVIRRRGR